MVKKIVYQKEQNFNLSTRYILKKELVLKKYYDIQAKNLKANSLLTLRAMRSLMKWEDTFLEEKYWKVINLESPPMISKMY